MTELKTLKDFIGQHEDREDYYFKSEFVPRVKELRQLAIKWIKKLEEDKARWLRVMKEFAEFNMFPLSSCVDKGYDIDRINFLMDWIKHFFNIKEEDIK